MTLHWSFSASRYYVLMERKSNDPNDSKVDDFVKRIVSRFASSSRQIENTES
jgi:hypothetical protein